MLIPTHIVAVGGIVENDLDEILLVRTSNYGWVFPGGQVENGENVIDALKRSIKQQTDIDVSVTNLIGIYSNTGSYRSKGLKRVPTKVILDYKCTFDNDELRPFIENSEYCWVHKGKVMEMLLSSAIQARYQAYLDFNGAINFMEYVTRPCFQLKIKRTI